MTLFLKQQFSLFRDCESEEIGIGRFPLRIVCAHGSSWILVVSGSLGLSLSGLSYSNGNCPEPRQLPKSPRLPLTARELTSVVFASQSGFRGQEGRTHLGVGGGLTTHQRRLHRRDFASRVKSMDVVNTGDSRGWLSSFLKYLCLYFVCVCASECLYICIYAICVQYL